TRDVKLVLATAGAIDGTLVGFTTTPVITGSQGGHNVVDFEVGGGHFSAPGLPPGSYKVTADTNGQDSDTAIVTVAAGKTAPVTLTSRGTATVMGTVIDWKTQAPIAGAMCHTPIPCVGHEFAAI